MCIRIVIIQLYIRIILTCLLGLLFTIVYSDYPNMFIRIEAFLYYVLVRILATGS